MPQLKLRVKKASSKNPSTKQLGFVARVKTNGTADFEEIVKEAGHNTTMHKAELKMAFELCLDSVAEMLKQGYIVDLGPIGKLYPSCSAGWYEKEEDLKLSDVKPSLYYRAGEDVEAAIKGAKLVWAKESDEEEDEEESLTPDPSSEGEGNQGGQNGSNGDPSSEGEGNQGGQNGSNGSNGSNEGGGTGTIDTGGNGGNTGGNGGSTDPEDGDEG